MCITAVRNMCFAVFRVEALHYVTHSTLTGGFTSVVCVVVLLWLPPGSMHVF